MVRRSKRKQATNPGGSVRRSRRKIAAQLDDNKIYGLDYGILPSD